jgi:hypothetical protein
MNSEYCVYPPQTATDLELAEQQDGARQVWMAGAASVGRYLMLGATERSVLALIDGERTPRQISEDFFKQHGGKLSLGTLVKFLTKLESCGLLAGARENIRIGPGSSSSQTPYIPIRLFNPDPLFTRLLPRLRWIWTTGFFIFSLTIILGAALLALVNTEEVSAYSSTMVREHYLAIFIAAYFIGVTHEFAHGLTCKAFGGRATEVGVLIVYYFIFALYCNVSGIHLIPTRGRRLWVIAAGVYWQLMVGASLFLCWFLLAPHTLLADVAFICLLGSVLDVFFNANPLIKLDGYYFLSQWLRLPNLMGRSRSHWRGLLKQFLCGEFDAQAARYDRRESAIYLIFGLLSFIYNIAFASLILSYIGDWLVARFYLFGMLLTSVIAVFFIRRPVKQTIEIIKRFVVSPKGNQMSDHQQTSDQSENGQKRSFRRRRLMPISLAGLVTAALLMPWRASVGSYGQLVALPDHETIIRAPEAATLVRLNVKPGDQLASGATIGRLGSLDLEERIAQTETDLARVRADYDRLLGEMRVREESAARADLALQQRQREFAEIDSEERHIRTSQLTDDYGSPSNSPRPIKISNPAALVARYPAALAALQADADSQRALSDEANLQSARLRQLYAQGLIARSHLDAQEARAAALAGSFDAARRRLDAALTEHRRQHTSASTGVRLAETDVSAERLAVENLSGELRGLRGLIGTLETRRDLLQRQHGQFELITLRAGRVFGEELPRLTGQFFQKGAEICRVADTRQLLVRIQVPEREIGDVRTGAAVRLKARALPDQTFHGLVTKIGGEAETASNGETIYRVELTIDNGEGLLRPGMTAFARIDFDRRMLARVLLHKLKQALRPELWIL